MPELYDHELEQAAIATLADGSQLSPGRAALLLEQSGLAAEDFHLPAHAEVFGVVEALIREKRPADLLSVRTRVPKAAPELLAQLLAGAGTIEHAFAGHAATLKDLALRRRVVTAARDLAGKAADLGTDPTRLLARAGQLLAGLTRRTATIRDLDQVLVEVERERAELQEGNGSPVMPTGLDELDRVIGGLQPTLTVIGAHPGVGKSALLGAIIRNLAREGRTVGVFSLEDQASWLVWRYLSAETAITQFVLRTRPLSEAQHQAVGEACGRLHGYAPRILVDDRTGLTPREVVQTARDLILNRGARALIVDHLGELRYESRRTERYDLDVAEGLSDLRGLAKTYGVPVVCATHLRREAADPPRLFDFANAAAIERQARVALALTRKPDGDELLVHVLKQTNGRAGVSVALPFSGSAALVGRRWGDA